MIGRAKRKPTWGTCAGLILLAEVANKTKDAGQELIGGLDVRVNRNHFGRQMESFHTPLNLPFLDANVGSASSPTSQPFEAFFIRAPIVEELLSRHAGTLTEEIPNVDTVVAPARSPSARDLSKLHGVQVLATLPDYTSSMSHGDALAKPATSKIVVVLQNNILGTSFHPELTNDARLHIWWLEKIRARVDGLECNDDDSSSNES